MSLNKENKPKQTALKKEVCKCLFRDLQSVTKTKTWLQVGIELVLPRSAKRARYTYPHGCVYLSACLFKYMCKGGQS